MATPWHGGLPSFEEQDGYEVHRVRQLRTALRAYAVEGLQPAEVVAKLHRLVGHLRVGLSTTLAYLDLDPFTLELRYVSAGHLPVLHVPAGGSPRFLTGARS